MSSNTSVYHFSLVSSTILEQLSNLDLELSDQPWSQSMWSNELSTGLALFLFVLGEETRWFCSLKLEPFGESVDLLKILIGNEFRRQGLGGELFESGVRFLKPFGLKKVLLDVSVHNNGALCFYKLLNFSILVERKAYYSNGDNAFLMELNLT